jgi:hypothetical protein
MTHLLLGVETQRRSNALVAWRASTAASVWQRDREATGVRRAHHATPESDARPTDQKGVLL